MHAVNLRNHIGTSERDRRVVRPSSRGAPPKENNRVNA